MKKFHRAAMALLTLVVAHLFVPAAAAHPLGNFTINHYARLHVSREAILVDYVLDMAEIPAFQEIAALDANGNGQPDGEESARYHPAQCEAIRSPLDLRLNGRPADPPPHLWVQRPAGARGGQGSSGVCRQGIY